MAKIILGNLVPRAASITGGRFYVRDTKYGPVAQGAPNQPKHRNNATVQWWREQFAIAARMASTPEPLSMLTAIEMAKGTEQVPRDILMMCAYGTYYEIFGPDGQQWLPSYKGPPPKKEVVKRMLMLDAGLWDDWGNTGSNTYPAAFKGQVLEPLQDVPFDALIARFTPVAGGVYRAIAAEITSAGTITVITASSDITALGTDRLTVQFDLAMTLEAGRSYAMLIGRVDSTSDYTFPIWTSASIGWHGPFKDFRAAAVISNDPQVGDTIVPGTAIGCPIALLVSLG